jgi:hypothetical protein
LGVGEGAGGGLGVLITPPPPPPPPHALTSASAETAIPPRKQCMKDLLPVNFRSPSSQSPGISAGVPCPSLWPAVKLCNSDPSFSLPATSGATRLARGLAPVYPPFRLLLLNL